jgi:regulator of replication initiation timing
MAGEFHDAFDVGNDDEHIATVDADGVTFAAIQGLSEKVDERVAERDDRIVELEAETEELRAENEQLRAENERLRERLDAVEVHLGLQSRDGAPADD